LHPQARAARADQVRIGTKQNIKIQLCIFWEDPYFLDSAHALIFGSTHADQRLTFVDNINLTASAATEYSEREFRVVDNPNSFNDCARVSGVISGTVRNDLIKTGGGILELTGANTYLGGTIVADGTVLVDNANSLGADNAAYIMVGARSGSSTSALRTSHLSGVVKIPRDISITSGPTGDAILGNITAPGAPSAGDAVFSGHIAMGITGSNAGRTLRLTAENGTTVAFSGGVGPVSGYLGAMGINKVGGGTAVLSGALTYTGDTTVSAGTLVLGSSIVTSSAINVSDSATATLTAGGGKVIKTPAISIAASGKLDLNDNAMIVDYSGATSLAGIRKLIIAGSISSSAITSNTGLGYGEASEVLSPAGGTFADQAVDGTAVLVRYTLQGDATLDRTVGFDDLVKVAQNYGGAGIWSSGDFSGDGTVGFEDLVKVAQDYGGTLPTAAIPSAAANFQNDLAAAFAPVPEPSLPWAIGFAVLTLRRRRATNHGDKQFTRLQSQ